MRKTSNFLVKIFHPIHQRATDLCRKNPRQVCLFIRTLHTWLMSLIPDFCFGLFLFFSGHTPVKIPVSLYRNFPFSCFVSCLFQFSLECNSGKRMVAFKILRCNRHNDCAVGIAAVAGMIAHSVDRKISLLRRRINHIASRTHTERIYTSSIRQFCSQLIGCCRKRCLCIPILGMIDQLLRVFCTYTNRKGFCLNRNLFLEEHRKGLTRTVSRCQNQRLRLYFFFFFFQKIFIYDPSDPPCIFCKKDLCHLCMEMDFTTPHKDFLPHISDHSP